MSENFLFHKVSEKEKQEIKKQAKSILEDFSKKLSKIDKKIQEPLIEREYGEREEVRTPQAYPETFPEKMFTKGKDDEDFSREIMFDNAPEKSRDFIIGEKGKW